MSWGPGLSACSRRSSGAAGSSWVASASTCTNYGWSTWDTVSWVDAALASGYVSPVATLIRWFPNRRGMATGMAIMGFGGGAIIGAPVKEYLLRFFYESPQYLGSIDAVALVTEGRQAVCGGRREVGRGGRCWRC